MPTKISENICSSIDWDLTSAQGKKEAVAQKNEQYDAVEFHKRLSSGCKKCCTIVYFNEVILKICRKAMKNTTNTSLLLHFSLIEGVGPSAIAALLQSPPFLAHDFDAFYGYSAHDFCVHANITPRMAEKLVAGLSDTKRRDEERALLDNAGISLITIMDKEYPAELKTIHLPPIILYCQGSPLHEYGDGIAIVGSRKAGPYAEDVISSFMPTLVDAGLTIISGGARGADTMAHRAALAHKGRTIAVLGSGLLNKYPVENQRLFEQIIANQGSIISPFPLLEEPFPGNFPARNRIIAGMSKACIVVQAAAQSGASITAHFALDQGKDVFAVPGSVFDPLSQGCHALLTQGAHVATCVDDIISTLGYAPADEPPEDTQTSIPLPEPTTPEGLIRKLCSIPRTFDELQEQTGLAFTELNDILFSLQLEGRIAQSSIGLWQVMR